MRLRKRLDLTTGQARSSSRPRVAQPSCAPVAQGPLLRRASVRSARRLPFRPPSRRPSASTGWGPAISQPTGWRCCTSRAAGGNRPRLSGWFRCTCAASATSPSAGSSGRLARTRGGRSSGPDTTRWAWRRDARSCPIGGSSSSSQLGAARDDAVSHMGAMTEGDWSEARPCDRWVAVLLPCAGWRRFPRRSFGTTLARCCVVLRPVRRSRSLSPGAKSLASGRLADVTGSVAPRFGRSGRRRHRGRSPVILSVSRLR